MPGTHDHDRDILAVLNGAAPSDVWPDGVSPAALERAAWHGVDLLLAAAVAADPRSRGREPCRQRVRHGAALDLARTLTLARIVEAASDAGVPLLFVKGAALGPLLYPAPHLRARFDDDLLVDPACRDRFESILTAGGLQAAPEALGSLGTAQSHWVSADNGRIAIDLHWNLFNAHTYRELFSFDELLAASVPVPSVSGARAPSLDDHLIISAVHRVAHHYDSPRLVWLLDIDLMVRAIGDERLARLLDNATRRGVATEVALSVLSAAAAFRTPLADAIRQRLDEAANSPDVRVHLRQPRVIDLVRDDLRAQPGWRQRLTLIGEHLLPRVGYMRQRYPRWPVALLPAAYVYRVLRGAPSWFHRARHGQVDR